MAMTLRPLRKLDTSEKIHGIALKNALNREGFSVVRTEDTMQYWVHTSAPGNELFSFNGNAFVPPRDVERIKAAAISTLDSLAQAAPTTNGNVSDLPDWLTLQAGYQAQVDNGALYVWSEKHPEFRMRFSEKPGERNVGAAYKAAFDAFNTNLKIYSQTITELQHNYGFEVRVKGNEVVIAQPDYELSYTFPLNNHIDLLKELNGIEEAAAGVYLARMEQYENLVKNATEVKEIPAAADSASTSTEIIHPNLKAPVVVVKHGALGRIDAAGAKAISRAMETIAAANTADAVKADEPQNRSPEQPRSDLAAPPLAKELLPIGQNASLVFDKSTLHDLQAPRGGDRTWTDLLPIAAALPTVDKIYIPSVVADWECRGAITRVNPDGSIAPFEVVDQMTYDKAEKYNSSTLELLKTASRFVLDRDENGEPIPGKGKLIPGKNPNIVIYESPIDYAFVSEVAKIADTTPPNSRNRSAAVMEFLGKEGVKNFGERSMEHVAKTLDFVGPVYVVSGDTTYLKERSATDKLTKHGFPVSEATTSGFVRAIMNADGHDITAQLEKSYPDAPVQNLTSEVIEQTILKYRQSQGSRIGHKTLANGYPDSKAFPYMSSNGRVPGESLTSIFRRGRDINHGDDAPYDYKQYPLPAQIAKTHAHLLPEAATAAPVAPPAAPVGAAQPARDETPAPEATAPTLPVAEAAAAGALSVAAVAAATKLATDAPTTPTDKVVTPSVVAPTEPSERSLSDDKPLRPLIAAAYPAPQAEPPVMRAAEPVTGNPVVADTFEMPPIIVNGQTITPTKPPAAAAAKPAPTPEPSPPPPNPPAEPRPPQPAPAPIAPAPQSPVIVEDTPMPLPFEETLGYKIGYHRIQREMTERQLADEVKKIAAHRLEVDEDKVYLWQSNQELPDKEFKDALVQALIVNNDKIADKDAATEEFEEAYQRSANAKDGVPRADSYAFANTLRKFRKQADLMDDAKLATILTGSLKSNVEESPDTIDAMLMFKIGANAYRPSPGMMQAIVKVLGLKPDEQEEILNIHSGKHKAVIPAVAAMPSAAPSPIVPAAAPTTQVEAEGRDREASEAIISRRIALAEWVKQNTQLNGATIADEAQISRDDYQFMIGTRRKSMQIRHCS